MDCLTAQGLISDAVDREPVDAQLIAEAKAHCQGCPTCSVYVRTLLLVKNVPAPAPPADLADRVMATIRAEHAAAEQRAAQRSAAEMTAAVAAIAAEHGDREAESPVAAVDAGALSAGVESPARPGARPTPVVAARNWIRGLSRQELVTWASAAVIFVAAIGIGTAAGIRVLTSRPTLTTTATVPSAQRFGAADTLSAAAPESGATTQDHAKPTASAGSYITLQGVVFTLSGPSTIATDGLRPAGTVVSALGSGGGTASHAVFSADDPDRVYVAADTSGSQLLAFDRVVRTFSGTVYQLTSGDLSDFGQWPTLPSNITAPTAEDGSPTFVALADDQSGAHIYRLATSGPEAGIGVAPGTTASDPAAGNPNWTWWTPVR